MSAEPSRSLLLMPSMTRNFVGRFNKLPKGLGSRPGSRLGETYGASHIHALIQASQRPGEDADTQEKRHHKPCDAITKRHQYQTLPNGESPAGDGNWTRAGRRDGKQRWQIRPSRIVGVNLQSTAGKRLVANGFHNRTCEHNRTPGLCPDCVGEGYGHYLCEHNQSKYGCKHCKAN